LATLVALSGCASLNLKADYRSMGEFNLARDSAVRTRYSQLRERPLAGETGVKVLVDAIPKGIQLKDGLISVDSGYQHRIVGKFTMAPDGGALPDYRDTWRKYVCYPQIPLAYLTGFMWAVFVPTYYPCFPTSFSPKTEIVRSVEKLVLASGGDAAVMSFVGEKDLENAMGATGFIIQLDPRLKQGSLETVPQKLKKEPVST
jgi:hypothetical protein